MEAKHTAGQISVDAMVAFLREHYLHSRFEGRDGPVWGNDYSRQVAKSSIEQVEECGRGFISHFESRLGRTIIFGRQLQILNPDEPPAQIQRQASNLTHIF
jgi:hypothetical protein